ncbi:putative gustatory receptor 28a isoform X1 [Galleria mellonella]|uniref:Gustatory receptor n=1 Tax=Galleria mellonella TaxID=7137 RepID=A0ABM3MMV8_GALME|nr:putative gustatory receptor 28a isoform X1 [Galleria mellonella]
MKKFLSLFSRNRKYNNVLEALYITNLLIKLTGYQVIGLDYSNCDIESEFSCLGLLFFFLWSILYTYCFYNAQIQGQSVLRLMFNSKLKQYGDIYEVVATALYFLYMIRKLCFDLFASPRFARTIINIDKMVSGIGIHIDYNKDRWLTIGCVLFVIIICIFRSVSLWFVLNNINVTVPYERAFQSIYSDNLALVMSIFYWYHLFLLRERYTLLNKVLIDIKNRSSWEHMIFIRRKPENMNRASQLQDKYICDKIKICAKTCSMLFSASEIINELFGFALYFSLLICMNFIIIYMFYFMEATASGLFHDTKIYLDFLVYIFWQIMYSTVILFINVYCAESTVCQVKKMAFIVHEVINSDLSPAITKEAMLLSQQLLHQYPKFTASGFYTLDYENLYQKALTIVTFILMILQFVSDSERKHY